MSIENTLGGLALAADGSSWPARISSVMEIVEELKSGQPPASDKLGDILLEMAIGIVEAHVSLECIFLATMPYGEDVSYALWNTITNFREDVGIPITADLSRVKRSFKLLGVIHGEVTDVRQSLLKGELSMDQAMLGKRILEKLGNFAAENPL